MLQYPLLSRIKAQLLQRYFVLVLRQCRMEQIQNITEEVIDGEVYRIDNQRISPSDSKNIEMASKIFH